MQRSTASLLVSTAVVAAVVVVDQLLKIWVKTNMLLGECQSIVGDWANLLFVENKGMAFGWEGIPTFVLSLLRIVACILIAFFLRYRVKAGMSVAGVVILSLILAGAMGNIIDNAFYGLIFSHSSPWEVACMVPFGSGYGSLFEGKVVDMFYFPIIDTGMPAWLGGGRFVFFAPVFNFADAAITCGVFLAVIFRKDIFGVKEELSNEVVG